MPTEVAVAAGTERSRQTCIDRELVRRDHGPSTDFAPPTPAGPDKERALAPQDVLATLDGVPGIDPARTLTDDRNRPTDWLDIRETIAGLSGT